MSLASANLSAKDASSLEQMSATVLALTKNTEELETQSQVCCLERHNAILHKANRYVEMYVAMEEQLQLEIASNFTNLSIIPLFRTS